MASRIEWVLCEGCGLRWSAGENMSPGVERETTCQRCLYAENARLTRRVQQLEGQP